MENWFLKSSNIFQILMMRFCFFYFLLRQCRASASWLCSYFLFELHVHYILFVAVYWYSSCYALQLFLWCCRNHPRDSEKVVFLLRLKSFTRLKLFQRIDLRKCFNTVASLDTFERVLCYTVYQHEILRMMRLFNNNTLIYFFWFCSNRDYSLITLLSTILNI